MQPHLNPGFTTFAWFPPLGSKEEETQERAEEEEPKEVPKVESFFSILFQFANHSVPWLLLEDPAGLVVIPLYKLRCIIWCWLQWHFHILFLDVLVQINSQMHLSNDTGPPGRRGGAGGRSEPIRACQEKDKLCSAGEGRAQVQHWPGLQGNTQSQKGIRQLFLSLGANPCHLINYIFSSSSWCILVAHWLICSSNQMSVDMQNLRMSPGYSPVDREE